MNGKQTKDRGNDCFTGDTCGVSYRKFATTNGAYIRVHDRSLDEEARRHPLKPDVKINPLGLDTWLQQQAIHRG